MTLLRSENEAVCFQALISGGVDIVAVDYLSGEAAIAELGIGEQIVENTAFASVQTVHAIAPNSASAGVTAIQALNAGLEEIARSGEWQQIIALGLTR